MKARNMAGALVLALAGLSGSAAAADPYLGLGMTRLSDAEDTAWRLHGGLRFNQHFAVEAAYHSYDSDGSAMSVFGIEGDIYSVAVRYDFIDGPFTPYAKLGAARASFDATHFGTPNNVRISESETGGMAEIGARYAFNDSVALRGGYEWFDTFDGDGGLNLAVEFSF